MAKKRKTKTKTGRGNKNNLTNKYHLFLVLVFASNNEIDIKLSPTTKEFIEKVS